MSQNRAVQVAAGIFSSRIAGLIREQVLAFSFGVSPHADVLTTAFRAPNALQVLLGEQSLSAAFIPAYARLLEEGKEEEAGRLAGAIFGLLLALAALLTLLGILLARPLVAIFAAGYLGDAEAVAAGELTVDRFELAVSMVRIIFPMTGLLVLSAWTLGVLNSHRRFFLPYFAPVLWNAAVIAAVLWAGGPWLTAGAGDAARTRVLFAACFGALIGGGLQFFVQVPSAARLLRGFRLSFSTRVAGVRGVLRAFGPALAGRGVVQLSLYLDHLLATLLAVGALGAIRWGSILYALPISLFAMSVAAAELPELSRARGAGEGAGDAEARGKLVERSQVGLRQIAFLVAPTTIGYLAFGFLLVGVMFRHGQFGLQDNWLVYLVLCAYTLGLPGSAASRLLQNLFFALRDTKTPARIAGMRVAVAAVVGAAAMYWLDRFAVADLLRLDLADEERMLFLGAPGLALGSAVGAWLEVALLSRSLRLRLPEFRLPTAVVGKLLALALAATLPAALLWWFLPPWPILASGPVILGVFASGYLLLAWWLDLPELRTWTGRLSGRFRRQP